MRATPSNLSFRPAAENLEAREVPATVTMGTGLYAGYVLIDGDANLADEVQVYQDRGENLTSTLDDKVWVLSRVAGGTWRQDPYWVLNYNPNTGQFTRIVGVMFYGRGGNDNFANFTSTQWSDDWGPTLNLRTVAYGGDGNDWIMAANNNDFLDGGANDDTLYGDNCFLRTGWDPKGGAAGGNDQLYGGTGTDTIHGCAGRDYLDGGRDGRADILWGDAGGDTFRPEYTTWGYITFNLDEPKDGRGSEGDIIGL